MLFIPILRGTAAGARLIYKFFVYDTSVSTGAGLPSNVYSDFTVKYIRQGEALSGAITPQDIATIGTYAAPTANTNCRIKEIANAEPMVGWYELQLHLDWVATTNTPADLTVFITCTGGKIAPIEIPLTTFDMQTAIAQLADSNAILASGTYGLSALNTKLNPISCLDVATSTRQITSSLISNLDAAVSSRQATSALISNLDAAISSRQATSALISNLDAAISTRQATVGNINLISNLDAAVSTRQVTYANLSNLDVAVSSVNTTLSPIGATVAKLEALLENVSGNRFTAKALETAPNTTTGLALTSAYDPAKTCAQDSTVSKPGTAQLVGSFSSGAINAASFNTDTNFANLVKSLSTMKLGTVSNTGFTPTTTEFECGDITDAEATLYLGRVIIFTSGAIAKEACIISAYSVVGGRGHFTVNRGTAVTLSSAPANAVTIIII